MRVVGIDADTKRLAICAMDSSMNEDNMGLVTIRRKNNQGTFYEDYFARLPELMGVVLEEDSCLVVEDIYCFGRKGYKALSMVQGEILYEAARCGIHNVQAVLASTWRPWLLRKASIKQKRGDDMKELTRQGLSAAFDLDLEFKSEHEMEACAIALYGMEELCQTPFQLKLSRNDVAGSSYHVRCTTSSTKSTRETKILCARPRR